MAPAATSSSAKNALPSERARIRSTTAGRDRLAGDGLEVLGQLGPAEGGELDPLQVGEPDQLGQQRPQGWRRCSSSER